MPTEEARAQDTAHRVLREVYSNARPFLSSRKKILPNTNSLSKLAPSPRSVTAYIAAGGVLLARSGAPANSESGMDWAMAA